MQAVIDSKQSGIEKLSEMILEKLTARKKLERIDYLKCKLGIETFLCNVSKLSVIYTVAMLMDLTLPVFLFHLAYMSIRSYAYGAHSESSLNCTIISCLILVGIPFILGLAQVPRSVFMILYCINHFILKRYAPAATRKNGMTYIKSDRKEKLKTKVLKMNLITFILALIMPNLLIGNLVMFGTLTASLMATPFTYKLLKNEWRDA